MITEHRSFTVKFSTILISTILLTQQVQTQYFQQPPLPPHLLFLNNRLIQQKIPLVDLSHLPLITTTPGSPVTPVPDPHVVTPDPLIPEINSPCVIDNQCDDTGSRGVICEKGWCRCGASYVQVNSTHCLPGMLLGFACEIHNQCQLRVQHSGCSEGFCQCAARYVPYKRNKCLPGSQVGEACRSLEQCEVLNENSFCDFVVAGVYGRCKCKPGTNTDQQDTTCGITTLNLGSACSSTDDCDYDIPGSVCSFAEQQFMATLDNDIAPLTNKKCMCPLGLQPNEDRTSCIIPSSDKPVETTASLGQPCINTRQCALVDPNSICVGNICTCIMNTPSCSPKNNGCYNDTFQCASDGRCISWYFVCNGENDCMDASDEYQCLPYQCPTLAHTCRDGTCISRAHLCDGVLHCPDGSDEDTCNTTCPVSTFRCLDGSCLPGYTYCNAYPSCVDQSDEPEDTCLNVSLIAQYCPFRCSNGLCRSTAILCSGSDGCGDNSDEMLCQTCKCPKPT